MSLISLLRRPAKHLPLTLIGSTYFLPEACGFCSKATEAGWVDNRQNLEVNYCNKLHLSPLFNSCRPEVGGAFIVEVVDDDTWKVSSGLARSWEGLDGGMKAKPRKDEFSARDNENTLFLDEDDPDVDEIDNMRIRGNLFYKLDRDSKEFEEYSFDFHRRKSSKEKDDSKRNKDKNELSKKNKADNIKDGKKKGNSCRTSTSRVEKLPRVVINGREYYSLLGRVDVSAGVEKKKVRTPTFNQLTGPYHEPFCLDIFISKASVRACIIHRVTSKVVAVAHSISKDLKFDLSSTRNATACAAVGEILAQRALADDIHDVVYTPRKGDRVEGKLQIVLQSIIDNGVHVKVKLKQRNRRKAVLSFYA